MTHESHAREEEAALQWALANPDRLRELLEDGAMLRVDGRRYLATFGLTVAMREVPGEVDALKLPTLRLPMPGRLW